MTPEYDRGYESEYGAETDRRRERSSRIARRSGGERERIRRRRERMADTGDRSNRGRREDSGRQADYGRPFWERPGRASATESSLYHRGLRETLDRERGGERRTGERGAGERRGGKRRDRRRSTGRSTGGRSASGRSSTGSGTAGGPKAGTVDAILQHDVVTVHPRDQIFDAVTDMADFDVGTVVAVEDGRPVGILSDRKVALAVEGVADLADREVEELMTPDPICVDRETSIHETLEIMADEGIRRLPAVDPDGHLTGIVAMDDVLMQIADELSMMSEVVQKQSPTV